MMLRCNNSGSLLAVFGAVGLSIGLIFDQLAIGLAVGFAVGVIVDEIRKKSTPP